MRLCQLATQKYNKIIIIERQFQTFVLVNYPLVLLAIIITREADLSTLEGVKYTGPSISDPHHISTK